MSEVAEATVEDNKTEAVKKESTKKEPPKQRSYFTLNNLNRYYLEDGVSYIEHRQLDEGLFESFQDLTSRIKLDREGETTEVDIGLGKTRKFLLENLVSNWNLVDDNGNPVSFSPKKLFELPPHVISDLVDDIYKQNSILGGDTEEGKEN